MSGGQSYKPLLILALVLALMGGLTYFTAKNSQTQSRTKTSRPKTSQVSRKKRDKPRPVKKTSNKKSTQKSKSIASEPESLDGLNGDSNVQEDPGKNGLFREVRIAMDEKDFGRARAMARKIINENPEGDQVPEALFLIGIAFMREGSPNQLLKAENQFEELLIDYPNHTLIPEVLMGSAVTAMHQIKTGLGGGDAFIRAQSALSEFQSRFPGHSMSDQAMKLMAELNSL